MKTLEKNLETLERNQEIINDNFMKLAYIMKGWINEKRVQAGESVDSISGGPIPVPVFANEEASTVVTEPDGECVQAEGEVQELPVQ